ncbi:MAG: EAL domain-containing protein [Alphaproteobacteria bacterium]
MALPKDACTACKDMPSLFPFTMAFQPIVDIATGRIDAHEALVRGPGGEGAGAVLAQVTSDNLYAFDQACRVKAIELAAGLGIDGHLNINFLPNAVYEPRACIRRTLEAAQRTGFPQHRLTFELVEQESISDFVHTKRIIEEYRRLGFQVALDDFGTGHSNLLHVAELRPDIVKIDRALVSGCDAGGDRLAIVRAIVGMSRDIGFKIVAEGVERPEEVRALRDAGVRFMQGFHFAGPRFEGIVRASEISWPAAA